MVKKRRAGKGLTRFTIILAAIVSILFAYVLWFNLWTLERVFALLFFVGGIGKLLYSILC